MAALIAFGCIAAAAAGLGQGAASAVLLRRFRGAARAPAALPPITLLKPLYGDEPLLEQALASFCAQDYPQFQIVFGLASMSDPARATVARLRQRFPAVDMALVVDGSRHGRNGKVGNLINMLPAARHDMLVIADSDIHAAPDALRRAAAALAGPGVGLATALYSGLPASDAIAGQLGAAFINDTFLPGALLGRALGRQDCLGAIMALRRETLERAGGFEALADHVADDALLGRLVRAQGLSIALIDSIPATTVPEATLPALFGHELRWARTTRTVAPAGFAFSVLQYPLFWAALALVFAGDAAWPWLAFWLVWLARFGLTRAIQRTLGVAKALSFWWLPARDLLSVAVLLTNYRSNRVAWRGQRHEVMTLSEPDFESGRG